ncbi:hypothetical protein DYB26_002852 [Aphanomyces astaci]|uniref:Uncharacterized protein n=2 Tax=Aphanomyces astaci TaxID=112090 RepID=A0A3R6Y9I7_APHAT|nr:hypothetical protein DYB26_002852 [Aphanomyces astaci]
MAFRIGSPRGEPLNGANEFLPLFQAYESEFNEVSDEEAKLLAELDTLDTLFVALKSERRIAPRTLQSMVTFFVKKRFGFPRHALTPDRRLLHHTTLLLMAALSKDAVADSEDDADALASLYEYMLDPFSIDGSTRWTTTDLGPHGSILFAFALFVRRVERTNDALYVATVSRLRTRQAADTEFEMDDTLSDVVLEKGRSLGGLALFSSFFISLEPESPVFDINDPAWRRLDKADVFSHFSEDRHRVWGLQDAGYAFFSRFVDEFGLLDVSKSTAELVAVVDIFAALVAHHPSLRASAAQEVFRLAEPLGLLFPLQFTAWMRLLASFLAPDTLDLVTHVAGLERPLATYTQHLSVEQHTTAAGDVITCDKVIRTPDLDIPVATTGQVVPLVCLDGSPTTLVCWHIEGTSLLTLWDVVWTRLKDAATCDSVMAAAALHWLAAYGRVAPARFDAVWRRWSTRGEAADVLTRHLASACGTTAAAALGVVAVLDPASLVADDDVIAAAMHAVVVSSHESSSVGVLACLQCWLRRLPAAPSVFVPLLLQLLLHHPPPRRVARVAAFRLVAQALVQSKVPFLLDLTLLSHGQSLLFDASTTLLQHPVEASSATTKEERGHFASFNRPTPAACPVLPYAFTDTSEVDVALVEAALHAVRLVLVNHPPGIETPHADATSSFAAYGRGSLNWPVACAAYLTCPSSSVRLVAAQVLAAVARHLPDSTSLMACFRTSDDATAFLTSLLAIVRHDAPRLQVAVWTLWTQCLDAQPSVLSLLFERPEAPSAIVDAVRGAHDGGQHVVVGAAVGFLLAIWDGLSRSNACHHLASLFRATPLFWATLTQPLGTSPPPPSSSSPLPHAAATYAHGAIFKLLAIEYHVERQATTTVAGASSLHEILASFRDLYDRWFHEYTSVTPAAAAMDDADVPAYVLAADVPPPLFALAQWTTFMEIYFLHPSTTSSSSVATVPVSSPSASAGSRSRLTVHTPTHPPYLALYGLCWIV